MIKRGLARLDGAVYTQPIYTPTKPKKVVDKYTKWVGSPGTIDKDGIWIPKTLFSNNRKEVLPETGKIKVPMRRSFYSGRRYLCSFGRHMGDLLLKKQCTDNKYIEFLSRFAAGDYTLDKESWRAVRKYQNHKYNTGKRKKTADNYINRYTEGYMAINGVVRIRKVLKAREIMPGTERTGVVVGR